MTGVDVRHSLKTVSEVDRSIAVQTLVYECTEIKLYPLRHSQPMKLLRQRRNMIIQSSSVNHASRCIDSRLKPIELVCRQSSKNSVAVIQPCQDLIHNQSDKRLPADRATDAVKLTQYSKTSQNFSRKLLTLCYSTDEAQVALIQDAVAVSRSRATVVARPIIRTEAPMLLRTHSCSGRVFFAIVGKFLCMLCFRISEHSLPLNDVSGLGVAGSRHSIRRVTRTVWLIPSSLVLSKTAVRVRPWVAHSSTSTQPHQSITVTAPQISRSLARIHPVSDQRRLPRCDYNKSCFFSRRTFCRLYTATCVCQSQCCTALVRTTRQLH